MINNKDIQLTIYATNSENFHVSDLDDLQKIERIIFDSLEYELDLTQDGILYLKNYNFPIEINEKFRSGYFEVLSKDEWLQVMQDRINSDNQVRNEKYKKVAKKEDHIDNKNITLSKFNVSLMLLVIILCYLMLKFLFPAVTTVNDDNMIVGFGFKFLVIVFIVELLSIYKKYNDDVYRNK